MRRLAIIPVYREIGKIGTVIERFTPESVDEVCLVVDDPDETILKEIDESRARTQVPVTIIKNPARNGIGFAIKKGYRYALSHGFDLVVVMAGKGQDNPQEISPLSKIYSHTKRESYSHISPLKDWQQIVGPVVLLRLGARH